MRNGWLAGLALAVACASSNSGSPDAQLDGTLTPPDAADDTGDGFPVGAIAFFLDTDCPSGWATYADGLGRTIVLSSGDATGVTAGAPLAANEQRKHHHALDVQVDLSSVSYAGIAGEANHGVAQGGVVSGGSQTDDGLAGLPYAQLLICEKTAPAGSTPPPSGVIAFFAAASCPVPWTEAPASLQGRFVVATPAAGTAGATFGGAPLASGEVRTHSHTAIATVGAGSHGIALASGCCAGGYGAAGDHAATATAAATAADLPYVQLLACVAP